MTKETETELEVACSIAYKVTKQYHHHLYEGYQESAVFNIARFLIQKWGLK